MSGPALDAIDLIEQLGDAVVAADLDGKITYFNAAAEELYGYTAEEILGQDLCMLAPDATSELLTTERSRVLAGETRRVTGHMPDALGRGVRGRA